MRADSIDGGKIGKGFEAFGGSDVAWSRFNL